LEVSQLPNDAAASIGLYALGTVVRGSKEARAAFYAASGLAALESAMGRGGGGAGGRRVRTKALHLLTDLLELSYEGLVAREGGGGGADDGDVGENAAEAAGGEGGEGGEGGDGGDEIQRLATSVLPQFAGAALHLLQNAEGLRAHETALLALRTIVARRPEDGREVLEALGAEGVLREALVELEAGLMEGAADMEQQQQQQQEGSGPGPGEGGGESERDEEDQAYRHYLAGLCSDLLAELTDGDDGPSFLGHDEL